MLLNNASQAEAWGLLCMAQTKARASSKIVLSFAEALGHSLSPIAAIGHLWSLVHLDLTSLVIPHKAPLRSRSLKRFLSSA